MISEYKQKEATITKIFESYELSDVKFDGIITYAEKILKVKNDISVYIFDNIESFLSDMSRQFINQKTFITKLRSLFPNILPNHVDGETYKEIHTNYSNTMSLVNKKLVVREKVVRDVLYYKKKTIITIVDENGNKIKEEKNKGDVREIRYKYIETPKTRTITYLARYGSDTTLEYIDKVLKDKETSKSKLKVYEELISVINEYGFDELYKQALEHRKEVFEKYLKAPIYESINFKFDSRVLKTFIYNDNKKSKVKAYAVLSIPYVDKDGVLKKEMYIPLKLNKRYHGKLEYYYKQTKNNHLYITIVIKDDNRIAIHTTKKRIDNYRIPTENDKYAGVDVNTNGDLIVMSNNIHITHNDDKIISKISKLTEKLHKGQKREKKLSKKQKRDYNPNNALNKQDRRTLKKLSDVMKDHNTQRVRNALIESIECGVNHIVLENLDGKFGKSYAVDKKNKQNFNNKTAALQLSSIKDIFKHLCIKYLLSFSIIQKEYTSQRCPKCGCIYKSNRKTQSQFECVECGYTANADENATDNMIHRVTSKKLCEALLKLSDIGYIPNDKNKHEDILDILISDSCNELPDYCYVNSNKKDD